MRAQPLVLLTVCLTIVLAAFYVVHPRLLARPAHRWLTKRPLANRSISELARAVGDVDPARAAAARKSLLEQIAATRLEPTPQAAARLEELSAALARECVSWHAETGQANAELANKILAAAGSHFPVPTRDVLVARCEIVLRAAHAASLDQAADRRQVAAAVPTESPTKANTVAEHPIAALSFDAPLAQFPGGGLPIERAGPALPAAAKSEPERGSSGSALPGSVSGHSPRLAAVNGSASAESTAADGQSPLPLSAPSEQLLEMPRFQREAAHRRRHPIAAAAAVVAVQQASRGSTRPTSPVIEMAQRLHSPVDATRVAARAELRAIGYSDVHVELLHAVTDADAEKRAAAARALPVMRGMNARPWLLWLSYDDLEEVRHAALSVLATSYDPELMDRMREAANADAAPRVRRLAETYLTNMAHR
ncbi:MAG: HEAT repeat domain-containing protein [Pirellulales bacterium]|nr:HEAT repeat domain-containing protein [Pirellulales bacterium]